MLRSSCEACRLSKVKCDSGKPSCARCVRQNRACEYGQLLLPSGRPAPPELPAAKRQKQPIVSGVDDPLAAARHALRDWEESSRRIPVEVPPDEQKQLVRTFLTTSSMGPILVAIEGAFAEPDADRLRHALLLSSLAIAARSQDAHAFSMGEIPSADARWLKIAESVKVAAAPLLCEPTVPSGLVHMFMALMWTGYDSKRTRIHASAAIQVTREVVRTFKDAEHPPPLRVLEMVFKCRKLCLMLSNGLACVSYETFMTADPVGTDYLADMYELLPPGRRDLFSSVNNIIRLQGLVRAGLSQLWVAEQSLDMCKVQFSGETCAWVLDVLIQIDSMVKQSPAGSFSVCLSTGNQVNQFDGTLWTMVALKFLFSSLVYRSLGDSVQSAFYARALLGLVEAFRNILTWEPFMSDAMHFLCCWAADTRSPEVGSRAIELFRHLLPAVPAAHRAFMFCERLLAPLLTDTSVSAGSGSGSAPVSHSPGQSVAGGDEGLDVKLSFSFVEDINMFS